MTRILPLLLILFAYSFCNAQFAVQNPESIQSKGAPLALTFNDFDGDGTKDIAYISETPTSVTILFSESDKSYTDVTPYVASKFESYSTKALSSGDINKDGKADIVFFDYSITSSEKIIVLISKGRTFEKITLQTPSTSTLSGSLIVMDWDKDSNQDIMLLTNSESLHFYKGNGAGQFNRQQVGLIASGMDMEIADLNNDSKPDIITSSNSVVSIHLSNGSIYNKTDFTVPIIASEIAVGDLTEDGLIDILIMNFNGATNENLYLIKNSNTFNFTQTTIPSPAFFVRGLDIADANNDGRMDIIAGNFSNEKATYLLLNQGSLNFSQGTIFNNYSSLTYFLKFEDLDGDSKKEIISSSAGKRIDIYKSDSNFEFSLNHTEITGFQGTQGVVEDINKDGYLDLVTASLNNYVVAVHYGRENNQFKEPVYFTGTGPTTAVGLDDINNDGYPDIFYCSLPTNQGLGGVIKSDGNGGFLNPEQILPPFSGINLFVEDLNNDGLKDIVYGNSYLKAQTDGSYIQKVFICPISIGDFVVADINNDTFLDIAITDYQTIIYYLNDGTGNFPSYSILKNTGENYKFTIEDINSDGKPDFAVTTNKNEVTIYYAQTSGGFNEVKLTTSSFNLFNIISGDLNMDNKIDLAVGHDDGTIDFFIQNANNEFSRSSVKGNFPNHMVLKDLNNDFKKDLILYSLNGNPITIIYNDAVFEPTMPPSNLLINNRTDKSATISLTKGNGNGRLILVREVGNSGSTPNDGTFYSFNPTFGLGAQLATKNYAVYRGSDQAVNINGLKEDTEYIVTAFEYSSNKNNTIINYESIGSQVQFKTKKNQTIAVAAINSKTIGDAPFDVSFSASSGLAVNALVLTTNASISNNTVTMNAEGPVKLKFSQSGNDDYMPATDVEITFCVNPVTPTITYASAANGKYILTSSSATNNIWLKNNIAIAGATNQTVEVTPDASYSVKVDYSGCINTSLPVTNQTINFSSIPTKEEGQPDFPLTATATSSLPISYDVVSGGIEITNSSVKINSPGPAKIKAAQAGSSGFFPATTVEQTFCVNPKVPTVTVTTTGPGQITLTSSSDLNNNWLKNGVAISGATNKTYEPKEDGVYAVKVDYSGCNNTSAPTANLITGIEELINSVSLYPNPANGIITIEWPQQSIKLHKLTLLDSQGKSNLLKYEMNGDYVQFSVSDFPTGIYLLNMHSDKGVMPIKVMKN